MKKEESRWDKAWFNKEVWIRMLKTFWNVVKYILVIMWIWGIWSLVLFFWSEKVNHSMRSSFYCIFNWCDNFNFKTFRWFPIGLDDIPEYEEVSSLPIGETFKVVPNINNWIFYKFSPKYKVWSLVADLELQITWEVSLAYYEYELWKWYLDTKFFEPKNIVFKSWKGGNLSNRCYIFRWIPRYYNSDYVNDIDVEFREWENPNNCIPIFLPRSFKDVDWLFRFVLNADENWIYKTWMVSAEYRYWNYY